MNEPALRMSGRVRGIVIAYGVGAFTWFFSRALPHESAGDPQFGGASSPIAIGLAVQIVLLIARFLVKRHEREHGTANEMHPQAMYLLELLADAVTVLLFAIGTFRAILALPSEIS